ncbi:MAG TPA: FAD-dependent oxidoreductase, partial [Pseudomonadales bacterium]|nr:FAD-dependent oxidoreductase [Pseudomonadales bacterium]
QPAGGGFMRSQIPSFRLPLEVLDQEVNFITDMGVVTHYNTRVDSLNSVLAKSYDAIFVGTGAPRGRDLKLPGSEEAAANIRIGINFLADVAFGHTSKIGKRVLVIGGGNTAMDCCRTARRIGGEDVRIVVRSPFEEMKASPWEIEDAQHEGIPFFNNHIPKEYVVENGKLVGMRFEKAIAAVNAEGRREMKPTGEIVFFECDDVLMAVGQENAFPWIEADSGVAFDKWGTPVLDEVTFQSSNPKVFFGGDSAFGPKNVITAVAHGHQAAISIDLFCHGKPVADRLAPGTTLVSQKMGIHEWSYDSDISHELRHAVPHAPKEKALSDRMLEVELGFDRETGYEETQRCLNCDVQTVFTANKCIECDACVDICPTRCITFTAPAEEEILRQNLSAPAINLTQDLYIADNLGTGRVMVKDEDVCLHCGLCAERCPTSAWDMQKYLYSVTKAGNDGSTKKCAA